MNAREHESFEDSRGVRIESRLRALGTRHPVCSHPGCTESDPFALTGVDPHVLCREHDAYRLGRSWIEQHHPAGHNNDPQTLPIPANDHGVASENQALWPRETLRNPDGSPLLKAAAALRGWLEILRLAVERTVGWIPAFLEQLDAWLREQHGNGWWSDLGWQ
jgi:hypothetical protein